MAEFKIADGLSSEVKALNSSAQKLAVDKVDIDTADVKSLKTSMRYVEQQKNIRTLLRLYGELLAKDSADLSTMIAEVKRMDAEISVSGK